MVKKSKDEERIFAFLCYLISIIGVVLVLATKKERSDFSIYHAKQGLVLFVSWLVVWVITTIIGFIPILGTIISVVLWILLILLWVLGMVNALTWNKKPLPIIGGFAKYFNL